MSTKHKISWKSKGLYNVLELKEDGDEVSIEVIFTGSISEAEQFIKDAKSKRN